MRKTNTYFSIQTEKKQIKVTQVLIIAVTIEKLLFLTSYQASSKFLYPLRLYYYIPIILDCFLLR